MTTYLSRHGTTLSLAAIACVAGAAHPAIAQPSFDSVDGSIAFSGTFEEYSVPNLRGSVFRFTVYGADGGDAGAGNGPNGGVRCFEAGGQGATAEMDVLIGDGPQAFIPGRSMRFVVGGAGETELDDRNGRDAASGGGGGSAVLYDSFGNGIVRPIIVAGGGGGSYASANGLGICDGEDQMGGNGQTIQSGGFSGSPGADLDPVPGGSGGTAGGSAVDVEDNGDVRIDSGGGGGWLTAALTQAGGGSGGTTGGPGGFVEGSRAGGFGFGGGGAGRRGGGGGGGYSGGGGGPFATLAGGGGSFTNSTFAFGTNRIVGGSPVGEDGRIDFSVIDQTHDLREDALPILFDSAANSAIRGSVVGATESPINGTPSSGPDVWYTYSNTQSCTENIRFQWSPSQATSVTLLIGNQTITRSFGPLTITVRPGQSIEMRVASERDIFSIDTQRFLVDRDGDGVCDVDDICPGGDDTLDTDGDGVPNGCDLCPGSDDSMDADGDMVPDDCDACEGFDDLADADADGISDGCDICEGFDDSADADGDGIPDGCEDTDGDGVIDGLDVCEGLDDNIDLDGNGISDCVEDCDSDGIPDGLDGPLDETNLTPIIGFSANDSQTLTFSTCGGANFDTALALWDPNGTLIASNDDAACGAGLSEFSQNLPAGSYLLGVLGGPVVFGDTDFEASYDPAGCPGSGPLQLTLSNGVDPSFVANLSIDAGEALLIPISVDEGSTDCLADVNNDGELNGADFNAWLNAFSLGDPAADQNEDGNLDGADFNAWLANFAAGCPE